jgi:hypothetical protein
MIKVHSNMTHAFSCLCTLQKVYSSITLSLLWSLKSEGVIQGSKTNYPPRFTFQQLKPIKFLTPLILYLVMFFDETVGSFVSFFTCFKKVLNSFQIIVFFIVLHTF